MGHNEQRLRTILGSGAPISQIGRALVDLLAEAEGDEERVELLTVAVSQRDEVEKQPTELAAKAVPKQRWEELTLREQSEIVRFLKQALFEARSAREFAQMLQTFLAKYPAKDARAFVLANVLYSWYLPFRPLPARPEALDDEVRKRAVEEHRDAFATMHQIAILPFNKTTEQAGLALRVLESVEDRDAKVALLALLIHRVQSVAGMQAQRRAQAMAQVGSQPLGADVR